MVSRFHSSSSMATAQPCFSYKVFLSFRGEDTRKNFTDHLYTALIQAGIRTFRDDDAMERGRLLEPELNKAIHESAISLIVFSDGYASSKWCLNEVMMIVKEHETSSSKHEVVPVFYKVEPSDVRNQKGSFKDAFDAYDAEIRAETNLEMKKELSAKVGTWRDSLRKAATLTGMVLADGYESKFITDIVNDVRKKLDYKVLYIEDKLVGIEDRVAEIESWLQDPSPDAVILLIDGMGGIGKSTIAKCIFNLNCRNYDGSCFLAKINETSNQPHGLVRLQSQLLSTILKSRTEETVWDVDEGTNKVINAISNKKVLLILDDVATSKQLDALLGPKRFHPGSKVIITTRNTRLLTAFKDGGKVHSVGTLSMGVATELFCLHAFHQHQPVEPYLCQSELVVQRCMGLPLALKVLGSSLREKTNDEWEDILHKLAAIPHPEIQEVLQISYESLADDKDKDLFLHIAFYLEGEQEDYIVKLMTGCNLHPVDGIKNLMDRCLLYVDQYGRVMMHELIKEMGREVVRKESIKNPGERSRLWHHQDCINVLQDHSGTEKVEGLMLHMPEMKEVKPRRKIYFWKIIFHGNDANFQVEALENMKNLMLLQLRNVTFSGQYKKFPKKLRLLSWHGFSLKAIPGGISLEKLVVLDMSYSKLTRAWDDFKILESLKIVNLSKSRDLIKTPDFGGLPRLESLILEGCSSLIKVDNSIANLKELVLLDLIDCKSLRDLRCLPRSLSKLWMHGCLKLEVLGSIENLTELFSLGLSDCKSLRELRCLPRSIKSLQMFGCRKLEVLGSIENLTQLTLLDLTNCESLRDLRCLPRSLESLQLPGCGVLGVVQCLGPVSSLSHIKELNLPHSNLFDNSFPNDWSSLVSLVEMNIDGNNITFLPKCIQTLPSIQQLRVSHCSKLRSVLGVPKSVNELFVNYNESLEKVQPAQNSRTVVYHRNCPKLCEIEGRYKIQSIDKVERKIIRYLGLESNAGEGMELDIKVFHEFGIFSAFVPEIKIPSRFTYEEKGSRISFKVPLHRNSSKIIGFNMCAVLSLFFLQIGLDLEIGVQNMTKDLLWSYFKRDQNIRMNAGKFALLSLWRCGNLLEGGDEIVIRVFSRLIKVEECCINLIYEDGEQLLAGERKDAYDVNGFDQMSWTDRMDKDISHYVCPGKKHVFRDDHLVYNKRKEKWEISTISYPFNNPHDTSLPVDVRYSIKGIQGSGMAPC
ncbi:hypothetical protein L2E82_49986 [Cichorium intybus]|nr:hypothetical protein L2E82_49986 [Cichorium intybus]